MSISSLINPFNFIKQAAINFLNVEGVPQEAIEKYGGGFKGLFAATEELKEAHRESLRSLFQAGDLSSYSA